MKKIIYFGLICIILSCSCKKLTKPPHKQFKEIVIRGVYNSIAEKNRPIDYSPEMAITPFHYSSSRYCYKQTTQKEVIYDKNLRFRLYDKKGKILAEDFIRLEKQISQSIQDVIAYLPYNKEASKIQIVKLKEDEEEDVIKRFECCPDYTHFTENYPHSYQYNKEKECFSSVFFSDVL